MPYKTKEARNAHRAIDKDRVNARQKEYRACNKENFHTYRLTFSHGMTREQLKEKQTRQGNWESPMWIKSRKLVHKFF